LEPAPVFEEATLKELGPADARLGWVRWRLQKAGGSLALGQSRKVGC
jgi:hypothetical protein